MSGLGNYMTNVALHGAILDDRIKKAWTLSSLSFSRLT